MSNMKLVTEHVHARLEEEAHMADRIWQACGYGPEGGFPIVINLSYGLKAGPKDGHMLIEEVIRAATRRGRIEVELPVEALDRDVPRARQPRQEHDQDPDSESAAPHDALPTTSRRSKPANWSFSPDTPPNTSHRSDSARFARTPAK